MAAPYHIRNHAILKKIIDNNTLVFSHAADIVEGKDYKLGCWLNNAGSSNCETITIKSIEKKNDGTYEIKTKNRIQYNYLLNGSESIYSDATLGISFPEESICYIPIENNADDFFPIVSHEILHCKQFVGDSFAWDYVGHPHVQDPFNLMHWASFGGGIKYNVLRYRDIELDYREYGRNNRKYIKQWGDIRDALYWE